MSRLFLLVQLLLDLMDGSLDLSNELGGVQHLGQGLAVGVLEQHHLLSTVAVITVRRSLLVSCRIFHPVPARVVP